MRRNSRRYTLPPKISPVNGQIGCNGKRQYPSKQVADKLADATRRGTGNRLQSYRCRHCSWWHVGSPQLPKPKGRPRVTEEME